MHLLKKYRDGVCIKTDRFESKEVATRFRKIYERSYHTVARINRKIYGKVIKF